MLHNQDDIKFMQMAIDLAKMAINQTSPNPSVGAVIVKNGQVVGIGNHLYAGGAHAEIYALNMNPNLAVDATLYVTLEPCNHHGRTPPCTDAIIKASIKRVVIATLDPNPLVSGGGSEKLFAAGIKVTVGVLEEEAKAINKKYLYSVINHLPYVTLKAGMSLDGKLATSINQSKWITSELARTDAHNYRISHDAILVGINTILQDNPLLTAHKIVTNKHPIRIILDTKLRTPITSQVVTDNTSQTWILVGENVSTDKIKPFLEFNWVKIMKMKMTNLQHILSELYSLGVTSILVEGGNHMHTTFMQNKLFNQLVIYMAPKLIGGTDAPSFFAGVGFPSLDKVTNLQIESVTNISEDIKIIANNPNSFFNSTA